MDSFDLNNALWQYSLRLYSRPGVSDACLRLQNEGGVDVVLMLSALYAQVCLSQPLSHAELSRLAADIDNWRSEVIKPLRGVRTWMKTSDLAMPNEIGENLRNAVKAAELDAERIQIAVIFQWLKRRSPSTEPATPLEPGWFVADPEQAMLLAEPFALVSTAAGTVP